LHKHGRDRINHGDTMKTTLKVRSSIKAGKLAANHNRTGTKIR
jgi:hypothetical protein